MYLNSIILVLMVIAFVLIEQIMFRTATSFARRKIEVMQSKYQYQFNLIKTRLQTVVESLPVVDVNNRDPQLIADFEKRFQAIRLLTLIAIKDCTDKLDVV